MVTLPAPRPMTDHQLGRHLPWNGIQSLNAFALATA